MVEKKHKTSQNRPDWTYLSHGRWARHARSAHRQKSGDQNNPPRDVTRHGNLVIPTTHRAAPWLSAESLLTECVLCRHVRNKSREREIMWTSHTTDKLLIFSATDMAGSSMSKQRTVSCALHKQGICSWSRPGQGISGIFLFETKSSVLPQNYAFIPPRNDVAEELAISSDSNPGYTGNSEKPRSDNRVRQVLLR